MNYADLRKKDFQWFLEHYQELFIKYGVSFLAIKDQRVLGSYPSYAIGVAETRKTEPVGSFIVQECNGSESAYSCYIASCDFYN